MRLHHLEIQAFGPFPERVAVDFDELSAAGLFLLAGPTGAGKTSVLDAVCFALYGEVPGDRGAAKRLRCDSAPEDLAPRVRLEVTLAGRRFRFTRSPQWQRPKRRGAGMTTEQAKVVCEERRDDVWQALSTRLDETGHLVTGLLGMTMRQFCQVSLLPQGEFQGFLRARSEERHHLLQQLFATTHFEEIERWLREHARSSGRHVQASLEEVKHLVSRFGEAAVDLDLPDLLEADLECPAQAEELRTRIAGLVARATQVAESAATAEERSREVARGAEQTAHAARETHAARNRGESARQTITRLTSEQPRLQRDANRLAAADRAAPLLPLHRILLDHARVAEQATERALQAQHEVMVAADHLGTWWELGHPDADTLDYTSSTLLEHQQHRLREAVSRIDAERPALGRRDRATTEIAQIDERLAELERRGHQIVQDREPLPAQIDTADDLLRAAIEADRERDRLVTERTVLEATIRAAHRLESCVALLTEARTATQAATDAVHQAREHWLDLREERITGMAAELASALAVGAECPVCGSAEHPAPATAIVPVVSAADERAARARLTDLEFAQTSAQEEERTLREEVAALRVSVGERSVDAAEAELVTLEGALAAATETAGTASQREQDLHRLRARAQELADLADAVRDETTTLRTRRTLLEETAADVDARIAALLREHRATDLETLDAAVTATHAALATLIAARTGLAPARQAEVTARRELEQRLTDFGFTDAEEALASALAPAVADGIRTHLAEAERARLLAQATLEEPAVAAALTAPPADLAAAERAASEAQSALQRLAGEATAARRRAERLHDLARALEGALDHWLPAWEQHRVAADLAAFVEGKSADNALRMRLSAYVLAWRLSQVVDAANERLHRMTGGRYTLLHTDRRGTRETRGGLSLAVLDAWTGEAREPATLSGGETFVVSLALALGLADVVTAEAGGSSLDTLFVDEGFGSLDSDTLDDVLDTLDELRDGGRVVGVVSHVAEMRTRIPTQLLVSKDPGGSRLRVRHQTPH